MARADEPADAQTLLLLGLRAGTAYILELRAYDRDGELAWVEERHHRTLPLPDDFVQLTAEVLRPADVSPGVTFFGVIRWLGTPDTEFGMIVGVDEQGEVVFLHRTGRPPQEVQQLANGHLIYNSMPGTIVELDLAGRIVREVHAADLGLDGFHHELEQLPSGNLLTLSSELRRIDGYPAEDGEGTRSYDVVGDVLVELSPVGDLMWEHAIFDDVDPLRVREGFDDTFWNRQYAADAPDGTKDYSHANALIHDARDGSMLLSLRHQDWLVKYDGDRNVRWRFGPEGDFDLIEGDYAYHQHSPEIEADGTLLVYDNGNSRPDLAPGQAPYSRVVQYELDEDAMEARQVWEYRGDAPYYAPFVGDVDRLPNGNLLITDGGLLADPLRPILDPFNRKSARVRELTPDAEIVMELRAEDPGSPLDVGIGWTIYRAERRPLFD